MTIRIDRDDASAAFYDGTAAGVLLLRHCSACGHLAAPAVTQCPSCDGTALGWQPAVGTATLISWAIPRDRTGVALAIAGLVELTEGPWLRAGIRGAAPEQLTVGLPLAVHFHRTGSDEQPGETVPVFAPIQEVTTP